MKKIFSILFMFLTAGILVACGGNGGERTAPVISGLSAVAEIVQGESIDVLEGVTVTSHDGTDIKDRVVITTNPDTAVVIGSVVTPEDAGSYLITLTVTDPVDSELTTNATIFLEVIEFIEVEEVGRVTYTFDQIDPEALHGFVANEAGEEVNALDVAEGALVYRPITAGNSDGDNQIFKLLELSAETTYTIAVEAKASRPLTDVAFIINGKTPGDWDPYAGSWGLEIGTEYETYELTFAVEEENDEAEFLFNVGGQGDDDYEVFISRVTIIANSNPQETNYAFVDLESETDGWVWINESGESETTVTDGDLSIDIAQSAVGIWEQKLEHTGIQLEADKVYKLSYTIQSSENLNYEFIARTPSQQDGDRDENYIWSNPRLDAGNARTVTHTFVTNASDINDFEMFFQLGNQESDALIIDIRDVIIVSYDDFSEEVIRFTGLPSGFESYEQEPAVATLYVDTDNEVLVYDVAQFGDVDWHNKVFMDNLVFNQNSRYRIEFTIRASKTLDVFFAINPMGEWAPRVVSMIEIGTEAQTFTFETSSLQQFNQNMEILFQFGEFNEGSATIYYENITIIELGRVN